MCAKIVCLSPIDHLPKVYEKLSSLGQFVYAPKLCKDNARQKVMDCDADVLFVNPNDLGFRIDESFLNGTSVKFVCTASTGTDHIDKDYCRRLGITVVALTKEMETLRKISSTAEMSFGLMLSVVRRIPQSFAKVKQYEWNCMDFLGRQLNQMDVGIVGYGRLGTIFGEFCQPFFRKIRVCDPFVYSKFDHCSLEELVSQSDVVSIHVHLSLETHHLINRIVLEKFKRGSYLINTSRGGLVNEKDVLWALENGILKGYGTDVLSDELGDLHRSDMIRMSDRFNIVITPHLGGATIDAQNMAYERACQLLQQAMEKQ